MKANKCDRCGKYYEVYSSDIPKDFLNSEKNNKANGICFTYENRGEFINPRSKHIDLCPRCMDEMIKFLGKNELNEQFPISLEDPFKSGIVHKDFMEYMKRAADKYKETRKKNERSGNRSSKNDMQKH